MPDRLSAEELNWYRLDGWASGARLKLGAAPGGPWMHHCRCAGSCVCDAPALAERNKVWLDSFSASQAARQKAALDSQLLASNT